MAFLDQLQQNYQSTSGILGLELNRITDAAAEPVTAQEVKDFLKAIGSQDDTNITLLIRAVRRRIEQLIEQSIFTQVWEQVQDRNEFRVSIYRRPVTAINSISSIVSWEADTRIPFSPSLYGFTKNLVFPRSYWPSHRGFKSFIINFNCGIVPLAVTETDATVIATAQADPRISDIKLAVLNYIGHLFENREGEGPENHIERLISLNTVVGEVPKNVKALLVDYLDYRP